MQDEKKSNGNSSSNGTMFIKDIGRSIATSALAGLILAMVTKGAVWAFPKLKI